MWVSLFVLHGLALVFGLVVISAGMSTIVLSTTSIRIRASISMRSPSTVTNKKTWHKKHVRSDQFNAEVTGFQIKQ